VAGCWAKLILKKNNSSNVVIKHFGIIKRFDQGAGNTDILDDIRILVKMQYYLLGKP
jgi:hypothetical protein